MHAVPPDAVAPRLEQRGPVGLAAAHVRRVVEVARPEGPEHADRPAHVVVVRV